MKSTELESLWGGAVGVAIVISLFAALAITAGGGWHWFTIWMESANAAAWVQAVGSIAAIGVGAFAIRWQVAQESRREAVRELKSALQEVTEIRELIQAALTQARADHAGCSDMSALETRARDESIEARGAALHVAFQEAHLDHIRSMRVRLIFVGARQAFGGAHQLSERLTSNIRSSVQFHLKDYVQLFEMPVMLLTEAFNQLNDVASELQSRLRDELGE